MMVDSDMKAIAGVSAKEYRERILADSSYASKPAGSPDAKIGGSREGKRAAE
jgi:hypothetical protein